jgi:hypothetical protein
LGVAACVCARDGAKRARHEYEKKRGQHMEKNAAIGKYGVGFFALVALAFAGAWVAGPGLTSAQADKNGASLSPSQVQDQKLIAAFANSAPFRDGLFQGKLAKQRGGRPRVSQSRWAFDEDQVSYAAGYQQAFARNVVPGATTLDAEER